MRLVREKSRKSPTRASRRRISLRMTPASSSSSLETPRSSRPDAALQDRELQGDGVERVAHLVGQARGEGPQDHHLLVLDQPLLRALQLVVGALRASS